MTSLIRAVGWMIVIGVVLGAVASAAVFFFIAGLVAMYGSA